MENKLSFAMLTCVETFKPCVTTRPMLGCAPVTPISENILWQVAI